jgi:hypothetical protein
MRSIILFFGFLVLSGCSHGPPSSCDGSDKRPLNAGKWNEVMNIGACRAKDGRS